MHQVENLCLDKGPSLTRPHLGFLVSPPRTGKSFMIISMLHQSPIASYPRTLTCSNFAYSEIINVPRINTNIVVVVGSKFEKWKDHITKWTDLKDQWLFLEKMTDVQLLIDVGTLDTFSKNILIPFDVFRNGKLSNYHVSKLVFDTNVDWGSLTTVYSDFTWILANSLVRVKKFFNPSVNAKLNNSLKSKLAKARVTHYLDYCVIVDEESILDNSSIKTCDGDEEHEVDNTIEFLPNMNTEILSYLTQNSFGTKDWHVEQNTYDLKVNEQLSHIIGYYMSNVVSSISPRTILVVFNVDKKLQLEQTASWINVKTDYKDFITFYNFISHTQLLKQLRTTKDIKSTIVYAINAPNLAEADIDLHTMTDLLIIGGYTIDMLRQIVGLCQRRPRSNALNMTRVVPLFDADKDYNQEWSFEFEQEWPPVPQVGRSGAVKRTIEHVEDVNADGPVEEEVFWKDEICDI